MLQHAPSGRQTMAEDCDRPLDLILERKMTDFNTRTSSCKALVILVMFGSKLNFLDRFLKKILRYQVP